MLLRVVLALAAAGCFVAGSMFMKPAAGFTNPLPSIAVFVCFGLAIVFDVHLVHLRGEIGSAVVLIGGLEATVAVFLARWLYDERLDPVKVLAIVLVLAGVVLLEWRPGADVTAERAPRAERRAVSEPATEPDPSASTGRPVLPRRVVHPAAKLRPAGDAEFRVHPLQVRVDGAP